MGVLDKITSVFKTTADKKSRKIRESKTPIEQSLKAQSLAHKPSSVLASLLLESPHISEKATDLVKQNKYVFKVATSANKIQIKQAIEELYGVKVLSVNIINARAKPRQLGRISGVVPGYKKAIVKLLRGQRLDILPQ